MKNKISKIEKKVDYLFEHPELVSVLPSHNPAVREYMRVKANMDKIKNEGIFLFQMGNNLPYPQNFDYSNLYVRHNHELINQQQNRINRVPITNVQGETPKGIANNPSIQAYYGNARENKKTISTQTSQYQLKYEQNKTCNIL